MGQRILAGEIFPQICSASIKKRVGNRCRKALDVFSIMRQIAREEGAAVLWTGWQPRALWHAPAGAVCWATYEAMKRFLGVNLTHVHGG